ncbi:Solute carrier organic anion transporter family member 3A1 [Sarcoptes scabiei]|uniref:Solute carrier organic anion transporter family member n=1 Tax=Sarcoptes scabiei TaxID=52283 RepID=A0A834RDD2_SARSC|nr:Solute carrier organic anion transporter family member 3A1 [Sarcoptes scabiei]
MLLNQRESSNHCLEPLDLIRGHHTSNDRSQSPQSSIPSSHHNIHHQQHHHLRARLHGHRRAKSAGNAATIRDHSSCYTASGLYAHQSGENLNKSSALGTPIIAIAMPSSVLKKTSSENTLMYDPHYPSYYLPLSNHHIHHHHHHLHHHPANEANIVAIRKLSSLKRKTLERETIDDDLDVEKIDCGFGSLKFDSLRKFATIQIFVFFCCLLVTLQQALSSGYFNSVITTIEKRFDISSQMSGAIVSTFEIGNLATIIFVSYFGTHRHIPRWIGTGIVVTAIGSLIFSLPHFMSLKSPLGLNMKNFDQNYTDNTCQIPKPALTSPFLEKASHFINLGNHDDPNCHQESNYQAPKCSFLYDHVPKESSSMYMGCMYSMVAFGLVCGFLLGGFFINVHENAFGTGTIPSDIFPGHTKWIGAWWAGFILLGLLLLIISIPFFIFPKSLKSKKRKESILNASVHSYTNRVDDLQSLNKNKYGRKLGEIPSCMWRLATNPVYMVTCLGSCMELAIVSGFLIFLPKYLETQFSLGKSQANLFAGGIAIPGACFGIFLGGYVLKRFQLTPKGAIQVVLFFNIICMGLYTALYFLGCENVKMAGTTLPYVNYTSTRFDSFSVNLTSECNLGCRCSSNELEPVCDLRNKISYYSPCFAGCTSIDNTRDIQNYSNCACLLSNNSSSNHEVTMVPILTPGPCPQICTAMVPFMVLLFIITLVVSISQMPVVMITLRSVAEEERSLALGMQFVLFRLFGYIPSPIVFGNVIDSSCLIWKNHCGQQGGFCLLYNIEQFRLRYVGVCSAFKITAAILFFFDLLLICYREKKETKQLHMKTFTAEEVISSIISLDRLSVFGWMSPATIVEADEEQQPLGQQQDSDYNSAIEEDENSLESNLIPDVPLSKSAANHSDIHIDQASTYDRNYLGHNRSESLV